MKKVLLGSTALLGAAILAAPAQAQLEVTVGGSVGFQAGWFDNDDATDANDFDFQSEADIIVRASGVADNGLEYGAEVVLQTSTDDSENADETFLYVGGTWGRLVFGDEDGASELGVTAPTVGIGQINGSVDDFTLAADRGHLLNDRGDATFKPFDSDDSTKVTYYTPVFSGFQAGASYVPELTDDNNGEAVQFDEDGSHFSDMWELALRYTGEFSGVGVTVGGQYNLSDSDGVEEEVRAWGLGAQLAYQGFKFGGGYTDNGDSTSDIGTADADVHSWNVGATYENGPWGVGISYLAIDFDDAGDENNFLGSDAAGGEFTNLSLGGTYTVAPGLTTGVDVAFIDRDRAGGADTDETVIVGEVKGAF